MRGLANAIRDGSFRFSPDSDRPIPKPILVGAGVLALFSIAVIAGGRLTGIGLAEAPASAMVAHRDLRLVEHPDTSAVILDAKTGQTLVSAGPGKGPFTIEALRNLDRYRGREGVSKALPFVLALKADGRLVVSDPQTHQEVDLRAFGARQAEAFAKLMPTMGTASAAGAAKMTGEAAQ
ncbi:hypothetical protein LQ948_11810 [Jiella sp. MQZ9-1]|uniref:Photosynthetic complex assembly protein n=1 Tax=Jiella flava TaxID=2816857 RepID=A0A939JUL9_9HYPH|nr:photosynthetic complex assembly protein PuhC [Jiella flava]MBO0663320.1 hypothetical protein [Jiella flava]MCD2471896.1 hypothetical protein [Jiella flava]